MKALEQCIDREPSVEGVECEGTWEPRYDKLNAEGQYVKALKGLQYRGKKCASNRM